VPHRICLVFSFSFSFFIAVDYDKLMFSKIVIVNSVGTAAQPVLGAATASITIQYDLLDVEGFD
jgi:hypothetical protein